MRVVLTLVGLLAVARPALAQSSVPIDAAASSSEAAPLASAPLRLLPIGQVPVSGFPANKAIHCCSGKGALIGAAIGAGLGFAMVYYFDDSGDRSTHYFTTAAVLGALGAGIGALSSGPSRTGPVAIPSGKRLAVAPVVTRHTGGGAVAVRF